MDYGHKLSYVQKNHLIRKLSVACEKRGTDATGIAYNINGHMEIHKKPLPAHSFHKKIPYGVNVVLGHTRLTTQGSEKINRNNHPFRGYCKDTSFALAHNGVLYNEMKLRREFHLPNTNIETDSYVAVQMIESTGAFNLKAIQQMAEQIEGSFCFTLLDGQDNLYLVKGNNPLTVYHFEKLGFYIYASTEEILKQGLKKAGFIHFPHNEVKINQGDILVLRADGTVLRDSFNTAKLDCYDNFWYGGCRPYSYSFGTPICKKSNTVKGMMYGTYLESLIDYAANVGVSEDEVLYLYENGFEEEEIEALLYNPDILHEYVEEIYEFGFV
ncbi:MAG: class II glutamine amidotransferase [Anaerotignum sp.]|nr:class II glutamine amidotransferase [Anaerotignum sp.]